MRAFLSHLAVAGKVAVSTHNQAKNALLFLYKEVLGVELPWLDEVEAVLSSMRHWATYLSDGWTPAELHRTHK